MRGRRAAIVAAACVALGVAALLILTVAPFRLEAAKTARIELTATDRTDDRCADITLAAPVTYSVTRPIVDLWGLARVDDLMWENPKVDVAAGDSCADGLDGITADVYIKSPACDIEFDASAFAGAFDTGDPECGGLAYGYRVESEAEPQWASMVFFWEQSLPSSGLVRGQWCLTFDAVVSYRSGDTVIGSAADVTSGDFCLDVS